MPGIIGDDAKGVNVSDATNSLPHPSPKGRESHIAPPPAKVLAADRISCGANTAPECGGETELCYAANLMHRLHG